MIFETPLAGLLLDNEVPLLLIEPHEESVVPLGNVQRLDGEIGIGVEGGRLIGSGSPDLAVRFKPAENLSIVQLRGAIVDLDLFTGDSDRSGRLRTDELGEGEI